MTVRVHAAAATLALCCVGWTSCAWGRGEEADPLEPANRGVFVFNEKLDDYVIQPVTKVYTTVTPLPLQWGVSNFFDNLRSPYVATNDLLQGKVSQSGHDLARFVVNTALGLGGLVDVATDLGLPQHDEDLGQTLAVWGLGEGAYLMLPVLGPTSLRDAPSYAAEQFTSVLLFVPGATVAVSSTILEGIDTRARNEEGLEAITETALDPYVYLRESWRQHRRFLIYDGHPPTPTPATDEKGAPTSPIEDTLQQMQEMESEEGNAEKKPADTAPKK